MLMIHTADSEEYFCYNLKNVETKKSLELAQAGINLRGQHEMEIFDFTSAKMIEENLKYLQ